MGVVVVLLPGLQLLEHPLHHTPTTHNTRTDTQKKHINHTHAKDTNVPVSAITKRMSTYL